MSEPTTTEPLIDALSALVAEQLGREASGWTASDDAIAWMEVVADGWRTDKFTRGQVLEYLVVVGERAAEAVIGLGGDDAGTRP